MTSPVSVCKDCLGLVAIGNCYIRRHPKIRPTVGHLEPTLCRIRGITDDGLAKCMKIFEDICNGVYCKIEYIDKLSQMK